MRLDLPEPVAPMKATVCPFFGPEAHMLHHTSGGVGIWKDTFRNSTSPLGREDLPWQAPSVMEEWVSVPQHPACRIRDPGPDSIIITSIMKAATTCMA